MLAMAIPMPGGEGPTETITVIPTMEILMAIPVIGSRVWEIDLTSSELCHNGEFGSDGSAGILWQAMADVLVSWRGE
jgi:hypothetical protein